MNILFQNHKLFLVYSLLFLCSLSSVWAQNQQSKASKSLANVVANTILVEATLENLASEGYQYFSNGVVQVALDPQVESEASLLGFTCSVTLDIIQIGFDQIPQTTTQIFNLEYKKNGSYIAKAFLPIVGAKSVVVKYKSNTNVPVNLERVVVSVKLEGTTNKQVNDFATQTLKANDNLLEKSGNLALEWATIPNADFYELEWTYVDNTMLKNGEAVEADPSTITIPYDLFKNNASKVMVSGLSFEVPMVYERGYLLYRLRGVSYKYANGIKQLDYGTWSNEVADISYFNVETFPHKFYWKGHERNVNWQSTISYAEEGKTKASIGFADGSLRTRQQVTRNNSENKAIVGETIYDHEGRAAIQVLPVPVKSSTLGLRTGFNKKGAATYNRGNFDKDPISNPGTECASPTEAMDISSGASRYYSTNNEFDNGDELGNIGQVINKNLIPDAGGYPFTQTVYMSDNTGRVLKQTGVGSVFKLGEKRETRYIYSSPTREELIRMFGNEVGIHNHYQKSITIDPNNQASISYSDMNGKTIATHLAGAPAQGTGGFSNGKVPTVDGMTSTLLDDQDPVLMSINKMDPDGKSKTYSTTIGVAYKSNYDFTYDATGRTFTPTNCLSLDPADAPKCLSCVLDVAFSLRERPCDPNLLPGLDNQQIGSVLNDPCKENPNPKKTATRELSPGGYVLTKKISINEKALDSYEEAFLKDSCMNIFSRLVREEQAKLDFAECGTDCIACEDRVNKLFTDNKITVEEKNGLVAECKALCDPNFQCNAAYQGMLIDVSPDGQYAEVTFKKNIGTVGSVTIRKDAAGNLVEDPMPDFAGSSNGGFPDLENIGVGTSTELNPSLFDLSVFNESNALPVKAEWNGRLPNWRYPYFKDENNAVFTHYIDVDGNEYRVRVINLELDNAKPPVYSPLPKSGVTPRVDPTEGYMWIYPEELSDVKDLIVRYWQESFAKFLVRYHPEYGYYDFCIANTASNAFDMDLLNATFDQVINLFPAAESGGFKPNPLDFGKSKGIDPFFASRTVPGTSDANRQYVTRMLYAMKNYQSNKGMPNVSPITNYNMWEFANVNANCPSGEAKCNAACKEEKIDNFEEWTRFLAFYISEKQKIVRAAAQDYAIPKGYYNGCIGNKSFQSSDDAFGTYFVGYQYNPPMEVWGWGPCKSEGFFRKWKRRFWGGDCPRDWVQKFYYGDPVYQFSNVQQSCNTWNWQKYTSKVPRFYVKDNSLGLGSIQNNCFEAVNKVTGEVVDAASAGENTFQMVAIPCNEDKVAAIQEAKEEGNRQLYEDCKQCPNTKIFQTLLEEMVKTNEKRGTKPSASILVTGNNPTNDEYISCFPSGLLTFGVEMEEKLIGLRFNKGDIAQWRSVLSKSNVSLPKDDKLTGSFLYSTAANPTAKLAKGELSLVILPNTGTTPYPVSFSEITNICCMEEIKNPATVLPAPLTYQEGYNFRFKGKKLLSGTNTQLPSEKGVVVYDKYEEVQIIGQYKEQGRGPESAYTFKLFPCELQPRCNTSLNAKYLSDLLSGLAYSQTDVANPTNAELNKASHIGSTTQLTVQNGVVNYEGLIRRLNGLTLTKETSDGTIDYTSPLPPTCTWIGQVDNVGGSVSKIRGTVNCGIPNVPASGCAVNLTLPSGVIQNTSTIVSFSNVRMRKEAEFLTPVQAGTVTTPKIDNSTYFLIDMTIDQGSTVPRETRYKVVKDVQGFTSCFPTGTCTSIVK